MSTSKPSAAATLVPAEGVCPKCAFARSAGTIECARCGIVFAKHEAEETEIATASVVVIAADVAPIDPPAGFGRAEARMFSAAFVAALVAYAVPFVRVVLSALVTLFHETGHAAASWFLGHPAVPAFDLTYGGGFTHQENFHVSLALLVAAGWCGLGWALRGSKRAVAGVVTLGAIWLVVVSSEWRREVVVASMGHGGELILAAVFLYMALANVGWRSAELERPLGAFVAFFVQIHTMHFAWKLMHDADFLAWYREGKGGALMNDLETVALDVHIHTGVGVTIETAASWLLALSLVPAGAAVALYVLRVSPRTPRRRHPPR